MFFWSVTGWAVFSAMPSGVKQNWNEVNSALEHMQEWNSYQTTENVIVDGQEVVSLIGSIQHIPKQSRFQTNIRLNDKDTFQFEAYIQDKMIYLYDPSTPKWVQMSMRHPTAGELNAMTDNLNFWVLLLSYAKSVEKSQEAEGYLRYRVLLNPFAESIHGILFEGDQGYLEFVLEKQTGNIIEAQLISKHKNLFSNLKNATYTARFSSINQVESLNVPKEAYRGEKLD
ncbi:hypothetical protein [Ammoniphilus resinae]|nr:hypothetical protein [Ammoniphilus resinae]